MENLGERIAKKRKEKGLTQNQLAEKLFISNKAVSKWESGKGFPNFELLPKLCEELDCSADYFIFGEESFARYKQIKNGIVVCIGKDENGEELFEDIAKFPHLLAVGEPKSGKSTLFHSFIMDIIGKYSKESVNLALIDCKKTEFYLYQNLPHLYKEVATTSELAEKMLEDIMLEMDRRFNLFQDMGIRNIFEYNQSRKDKLPFIVVIIDELANVISRARSKKLIIHLIKFARAAGIHLILGTQRLRSDTLPYELKEYISTRVCFKVNIKEQSEEYFNFAGGENLSGNGEMLFYKSRQKQLKKLQAIYYGHSKIAGILNKKGIKCSYKENELDPKLVKQLEKAFQKKEKIDMKI